MQCWPLHCHSFSLSSRLRVEKARITLALMTDPSKVTVYPSLCLYHALEKYSLLNKVGHTTITGQVHLVDKTSTN